MLMHSTKVLDVLVSKNNSLQERYGEAKDPVFVTEHLHFVEEDFGRFTISKSDQKGSVLANILEGQKNPVYQLHVGQAAVASSN
mmetsp:Transcript_16947/g.41285  ORF Transcript_16947/g.41285 Transcript_16947/m.41285 type:complete len:84 (-) Transcript_16947:7173-7424(-)